MNLKVLVRQNENGCSVHTRGWILLESTKWTKSSLPKNLDRIHIAFLIIGASSLEKSRALNTLLSIVSMPFGDLC